MSASKPNKQPIFYLMLGYPGAGKTTTAEMIAKSTGAVHLNSDRFRIRMYKQPTFSQEEHDSLYRNLDYLCELILKSGKSVIYDANLNKYIHRQEKYEIAKKSGAKSVLIYVKTDPEVARKRATVDSKLASKHRPFGNMEPSTFDRLISQIEQPKADEPTIEISGINFDISSLNEILKTNESN